MQEGVGVFQTEGPQRQSMEVAAAVQNIPSDRAPGVGQVQADLVGPSCDRQRQDQRPALAGTQHTESRLCGLALWTVIHPMLAVLGRIGPERFTANPFTLSGHAIGHREVGFLDRPLSEHARQRRHGSLALGEEQHPGGRRIQAVYEAQKLEVPRPGPPLPSFNGINQGPMEPAVGMLTVIRAQHPARRLVDGQHPTVLVEDVHDRSVRQFKEVRLGHLPIEPHPASDLTPFLIRCVEAKCFRAGTGLQ